MLNWSYINNIYAQKACPKALQILLTSNVHWLWSWKLSHGYLKIAISCLRFLKVFFVIVEGPFASLIFGKIASLLKFKLNSKGEIFFFRLFFKKCKRLPHYTIAFICFQSLFSGSTNINLFVRPLIKCLDMNLHILWLLFIQWSLEILRTR